MPHVTLYSPNHMVSRKWHMQWYLSSKMFWPPDPRFCFNVAPPPHLYKKWTVCKFWFTEEFVLLLTKPWIDTKKIYQIKSYTIKNQMFTLQNLSIPLRLKKKFWIRETPTLLTDADSRTNTNLKRLRDFFFYIFMIKNKKKFLAPFFSCPFF